MKKETELMRKLKELTKETKEKKLHWDVQYQTTEYNDVAGKPVEEENGEKWECVPVPKIVAVDNKTAYADMPQKLIE